MSKPHRKNKKEKIYDKNTFLHEAKYVSKISVHSLVYLCVLGYFLH